MRDGHCERPTPARTEGIWILGIPASKIPAAFQRLFITGLKTSFMPVSNSFDMQQLFSSYGHSELFPKTRYATSSVVIRNHHEIYINLKKTLLKGELYELSTHRTLWTPLQMNNPKISGEVTQSPIVLMNTGWKWLRWISQGHTGWMNINPFHLVLRQKSPIPPQKKEVAI